MINKGLFTSNTPEWETPQALFDQLNKEFNFTIDVCATKENAKCKNYFTKEDNGLLKTWYGTCWMNPPYGRQIGEWVEKAYGFAGMEYAVGPDYFSGRNKKTTKVVCLLPARTDTRWFHTFIYKKPNVEIRFLKGRLKFGNSKNSAPFPSMIVIFK